MHSTATKLSPSSHPAQAGASTVLTHSASTLPRFSIDRDSPTPLHRQIETWLRARLESNELAPGAMLPARKELCELFGGINHRTIRKAIAALQDEGLLFSVQGSGTFVADKKLKPLRIAIVLPDLNELTREVVDGIHETFEKHKEQAKALTDSVANAASHQRNGAAHAPQPDVDVVIFDSRRNAKKEMRNISQLEDLPFDGAIILPVSFGSILDQLVRLKVDRFPTVLLTRISGLNFNTVCSDDYAGSYAITKHVLERGRSRPAWIGDRKGHFSDTFRYEGYRDALNDGGIVCDRRFIKDLKMENPMGSLHSALGEALDSLLDTDPVKRPDAIICNNDIVALSCIDELKKRGLAVPADIAVTGFDDIEAAARATPALTTVRNPARELGHQAAHLILSSIQNPDAPPQNIMVPVSITVRESA